MSRFARESQNSAVDKSFAGHIQGTQCSRASMATQQEYVPEQTFAMCSTQRSAPKIHTSSMSYILSILT